MLYKRIYYLKNFFIIKNYKKVFCKINSRSDKIICFIIRYKINFKIILIYPLKIISKGQHIVFYKKNICVGGGEIFK
ncbi:aminomethyltransferase beta-barrel domain-containing protein [Candidatus Vidania fulgoroideorum]